MNEYNSAILTSWPPPYKIRRSDKARRIHLTIKSNREIELVLPQKASEKSGIDFFNKKRAWIEKNLAKLSATLPVADTRSVIELPKMIHLPAIMQTWMVEYQALDLKNRLMIVEGDNHLSLCGDVSNPDFCIKTLNDWLKKMAQRHLLPMLQEHSNKLQMPFKNVSFRAQKTLWGSCTPKKDIHLNYKLLFLPPELVRYVMIHELCHTIHLNHSQRFWKLVSKFEPNYSSLRKHLRRADEFITVWAK